MIPTLELNGWRAGDSNCKDNKVIVKYDFISKEKFSCEICGSTMQRRGCRELTITDIPYWKYDVELHIEVPCLYCPECDRYTVIRPKEVHSGRRMTLRLMGLIARYMTEMSARRLSGILRISESSILRADKDILTLVDAALPTCMDGRRALIIDEKYLGRTKKFVTSVIDGYTGEILWLKEGKGAESLDDFFNGLTEEQKRTIEVVSIDRSNAYMKALNKHLPHAHISFDPFHIFRNVNEADRPSIVNNIDTLRRT